MLIKPNQLHCLLFYMVAYSVQAKLKNKQDGVSWQMKMDFMFCIPSSEESKTPKGVLNGIKEKI